MMTLPSYKSHALQLLDVFCFKPFKTTFKKVRDVTMSKQSHETKQNNYSWMGRSNFRVIIHKKK